MYQFVVLFKQADLTEIAVRTRLHIGYLEAGPAIWFFWLYRDLPVTGIDGPEIIFTIDIHHFDRIAALYGPYSIGPFCRKQPYVKRAGL